MTNKIYQNLSARRCVVFCAHLRPPDYKNKPFVTWDPPGKAKSICMYVCVTGMVGDSLGSPCAVLVLTSGCMNTVPDQTNCGDAALAGRKGN